MAEEEVKGEEGIADKYHRGTINRICWPTRCGWQEEEVVVKSVTESLDDIINWDEDCRRKKEAGKDNCYYLLSFYVLGTL